MGEEEIVVIEERNRWEMGTKNSRRINGGKEVKVIKRYSAFKKILSFKNVCFL